MVVFYTREYFSVGLLVIGRLFSSSFWLFRLNLDTVLVPPQWAPSFPTFPHRPAAPLTSPPPTHHGERLRLELSSFFFAPMHKLTAT